MGYPTCDIQSALTGQTILILLFFFIRFESSKTRETMIKSVLLILFSKKNSIRSMEKEIQIMNAKRKVVQENEERKGKKYKSQS